MRSIKAVLPGLLLSVGVASISKLFAQFLPTLGAATLSILIGIFLGNTLFKQPTWAKGTKLSESLLLECSIVLLGLTVTFQTIADLGLKSVVFILLQMSLTIIGVFIIGRKMAFSTTMTLLMAGGNAVCGSSAIGAIAPEIKATEDEKGQAITLVNLLGTVLMLTLPIMATTLFTDSALTQSALIGGTLQSVGQVVASASMISSEVVQLATLFKIMRIMCLVIVVFAFGKIIDKENKPLTSSSQSSKKKLPLPWYIIGFVASCVINSLIDLPEVMAISAHHISHWFEITALAAIGLRLDFRKFFKEGPRLLLFGCSIGILQIGIALILITLLTI